MKILAKFFSYSTLIIPFSLSILDYFINNNYLITRIYITNLIVIYFIIINYILLYFFVLRKFKCIKEIIEGEY